MNGTKRPPLDELLALYFGDIAVEGVTTAPGNAFGTSFIDAGLAGAGIGSYFPMLAILYVGDARRIDSRETSGFVNGTGEVTLAAAYKGVAAAIPVGVRYQIRTGKFAPAAVAAILANLLLLMADVGDASASALGSIYAILGNPAAASDLATRIGWEGGQSLADKLTAVRALLLDEITALRLAELDPAGLPADVAAVAAGILLVLTDTATLLGNLALVQIDTTAILAALAAILRENADVPFNVNAVLAEANIFDLSVANTRYVVRSLRLKCVDPGAETVTVRLYELVNNVQTLVDTFAITTANFATAHSLADMFGLFQLAGDNLKVTVIATAVGPFQVTGQYCVATAGV